MVPAQFDCLSVDASHSSAIASIGAVDSVRSDEDHISSAASSRLFVIFGPIILLSLLLLDTAYLFLALFCLQQDVHPHEGLLEGLLVFTVFVVVIVFELLQKMSLHENRHFGT